MDVNLANTFFLTGKQIPLNIVCFYPTAMHPHWHLAGCFDLLCRDLDHLTVPYDITLSHYIDQIVLIEKKKSLMYCGCLDKPCMCQRAGDKSHEHLETSK